MFEPREIELSKKYLKEAIEVIEQPVVVLGGWAIYFLVNEKPQEGSTSVPETLTSASKWKRKI
jgi:uracil-DNA glycosylase